MGNLEGGDNPVEISKISSEFSMSTDLIGIKNQNKMVFSDLKAHIEQAQLPTGLGVNQELVMLYWQIGCQQTRP